VTGTALTQRYRRQEGRRIQIKMIAATAAEATTMIAIMMVISARCIRSSAVMLGVPPVLHNADGRGEGHEDQDGVEFFHLSSAVLESDACLA
jgi:hypothetical protein